MKFSRVSEGIFRGSQPYTEHDYASLLTFKSIIKLNVKNSVDEYLFCKEHGIIYEHIVMSGWYRPRVHELDFVVHSICMTPKPVFIHCTHGSDRTGFAILDYRTKVEKWSFAEAYKELMNNGHSKWMFWWNETLREIV